MCVCVRGGGAKEKEALLFGSNQQNIFNRGMVYFCCDMYEGTNAFPTPFLVLPPPLLFLLLYRLPGISIIIYETRKIEVNY